MHMAMITPVASTNAPITGINNAAPITPVLITPEAAFVWRPSFCKPKLNRFTLHICCKSKTKIVLVFIVSMHL